MYDTDHATHRAIMRAAEQIEAALPDARPVALWRAGRRAYLYDMVGKVDAVPRLGIACVFPQTRFGLAWQTEPSPFSVILACPGLPSRFFNDSVLVTQTGIHHELTHILLDHRDETGYAKTGGRYFNHPYELAAYLQQGLAGAARAGAWDLDDADAFQDAVVAATPTKFLDGLTRANRAAFDDRVVAVWEEGLRLRDGHEDGAAPRMGR